MAELPFKPGLIPYPEAHNVSYYPGDPNRIIRQVHTGIGLEALESAQAYRHYYNELADYNIAVAPFSVVIPDAENELSFVTDMIPGEVLDETDFATMSPGQQQATLELVDNQFAYIDDAIRDNKAFLTDIYGLHQYLFTPEDQAVLVDLGSSAIEADIPKAIRVQGEFMVTQFMIGIAGNLLTADPSLGESLNNRCRSTIDLICSKYGISFAKEAIDNIFALQAVGDPDEHIDGIVDDQLHLAANRALLRS